MRLWTLHPRYLDAKGLVAAWREALLAQKVLEGRTRGYKHHPQLTRFLSHRRPLQAMAAFLNGIAAEAGSRGYQFDATKISHRPIRGRMKETRGQVDYEWKLLRSKLKARSSAVYRRHFDVDKPKPHPLFQIIAGPVRDWERVKKLK